MLYSNVSLFVFGISKLQQTYLNVSNNMITESLCCNSEIGVHSLPMAKECIVVNGINLLEKDRDFDAWLEVGFRAVVELRVGKLVVDFLPRHLVDVVLGGSNWILETERSAVVLEEGF